MIFSKNLLQISSLILIWCLYSSKAQDYNVRDFGAKGDGTSDDTDAVRKALASANNTNGGRVIFDSGYTFLTGCFNVTSNVILDVKGTILGSVNSSDYVPVQPLPW